MKISYLLLHAYGTGGTIRTVFNQANALVAAGHDAEVVSVVRRNDELRIPLDPRVRVTVLVDERADAAEGDRHLAPPGRRRAARRTRLAQEPPAHIPAGEFGIDYFNRHVEQTVIDFVRGLHDGVLVTTRPALGILAAQHARQGVRLVAQEHMNLGAHKKDVRAAIARTYPFFDVVAVLTAGDREAYEALLPGTRVVHIPNAVHVAAAQQITYAPHIAVAAGRLFWQKGFDLLVPAFGQAIAEHPDWQLRVYGSGERRDELRALIEQHHLYNHVLLMGQTTRLEAELVKASFFVLSSRFEGLPMAMLEAMSLGLPVVAFDCPTGPGEVLTDGKDGLLVEPEDVDGLARAMGRLMADEGLRADLGAAALATARTGYAPEVVHPRWEALFTELAGSGDPARRK